MSKLLVSMAQLGAGGAERVLSILSTPLADSFEEVKYVMWDGGEVYYKIDSRVTVVSLPLISQKRGRAMQIPYFRKLVKRDRPDIILSFLTPFNLLVLLSTLCIDVPIVVAERNDPNYLRGGKVMVMIRNFLYSRATGILTQTQYAKSCYKGKLNNKTQVIYNPVAMSDVEIGSAIKCKKKKVIVSVGSLEPKKSQSILIGAFDVFHKSHRDYKLIIYGEGGLRRNLEAQIKELNLDEYIELPGRKKNIWNEMKEAELFVLSSTHEGMSNAMIEALCLGLPVITTNVAGATDLIKEGSNGFIVDVKDISALAEKMSVVIDDDNLRMSMSREAVKCYDFLREDIISKQWVKYLKSVMLNNR